MSKLFTTIAFLGCTFYHLPAQSILMPFYEDVYHYADRQRIKYSIPFTSNSRQLYAEDFLFVANKLDSALSTSRNATDIHYLQFLYDFLRPEIDEVETATRNGDSTGVFYAYQEQKTGVIRNKSRVSQKPVFGALYKTPAHMVAWEKADFSLYINPIIDASIGSESNDDDLLFFNRRGLSLWGLIDEKIYFYTDIRETQARFPNYIRAFTRDFRAVPKAGFYKTYRSSIIDFEEGVDFLLSKAYVGVAISKHVRLELGHNNHFVGDGYRSLLLSDFAPEYFYLKLVTKFGPFTYQNIWAEMATETPATRSGDDLLGKRYTATHYLNLQLNKLQIGLFESVVFSRNNQFELQYLNPIILYRTVEGAIGSPDNVLIGLNVRWDLRNKVSLYGQAVLDEFKADELFSNNGWWANKYGAQVGIKYVDVFGIEYLDAQLEYNSVRPFTYSHTDSAANYSHYLQALAHPLGANFNEFIGILRYRPHAKWYMKAMASRSKRGLDPAGQNFGGNILLPNRTRFDDFGNFIGQGIETSTTLIDLYAQYEWKPRLMLVAHLQRRTQPAESTFFQLGIRWNAYRTRAIY